MNRLTIWLLAVLALLWFPVGFLVVGLHNLWSYYRQLRSQVVKLGVMPNPELVLGLWVAMVMVLLGYLMFVVQVAPAVLR